MNNTIVPTEDGKDFVVLKDESEEKPDPRPLRKDDSERERKGG